MILESIHDWAPFRIDALGLVTMLGAEEVDRAVGRLVENPFVEYLPLLGAFVIAGNRFVQPLPGFVLYNISDGILATDVTGWLSKWLSEQNLSWNTTTLIWGVQQRPRSLWRERVPALLIGFVINAGLLILTVLVGDWFGFANAVAMIISVYVRWYLVKQNRDVLDNETTSLNERKSSFVKSFCLLADGRAVTLFAPRGVVKNCFLTTPRSYDHLPYNITRALGWLAFGCHVITIGQATLFIQILTVVIMIVATIACVRGIGCDELQLGRRINIHRVDPLEAQDSRTLAYARLGLSDEEEATMLAWALFPQRSNQGWWENYRTLKDLEKRNLGEIQRMGKGAPLQRNI